MNGHSLTSVPQRFDRFFERSGPWKFGGVHQRGPEGKRDRSGVGRDRWERRVNAGAVIGCRYLCVSPPWSQNAGRLVVSPANPAAASCPLTFPPLPPPPIGLLGALSSSGSAPPPPDRPGFPKPNTFADESVVVFGDARQILAPLQKPAAHLHLLKEPFLSFLLLLNTHTHTHS